MSVADKITQLVNDISASYLKIEGKGGTVPANKNTTNLPNAIDSIPSGGGEAVIAPIEITANGTYTASEGVDGYSPINVNVQGASLPTKGLVFENYDADGYPTTARFVGEWSGRLPYVGYVFRDNNPFMKIKSICIPEGIESMPDYCFERCTSLNTVTLPNTLTLINRYAFSNATGLTSITLPASLKMLSGFGVFGNCSSLSSVIFNGQCPNMNKLCFAGCKNVKIYDFSNCTSIPSIYDTASFDHASGCVIKVPMSLVLDWKASTNWIDLTDVIWRFPCTSISDLPTASEEYLDIEAEIESDIYKCVATSTGIYEWQLQEVQV